jgi:integrase
MASIRKRGDSFTISVSLGYDIEGKQIRKFTTYTPPADVSAGKAEKLAREYAVLWENKIRGHISLDENRTLAELIGWYFTVVAPSVLKESVRENELSFLNSYAMPALGHIKLKNITPQLLDNFFSEMRAGGRLKVYYRLKDVHALDGNKKKLVTAGIAGSAVPWRLAKGYTVERDTAERIVKFLEKKFDDIFIIDEHDKTLSPATVHRCRKSLSSIFSATVRKEIMTRNPVSKTTPITVPSKAGAFLDEQQAATLLNALETCDFQFKVMITTLIFTGMRGGELTGLKWENVDLDRGVINVCLNLVYCPKKGERSYTLQTPKTAASERYIPIPGSLVDLLKEHRRWQDEQRIIMGDGWKYPDMVFIGEKGGYYGEKTLNQQFKKLAQKIGLPDGVHIHSLRHTTASLLINADVPAKVVSEQLGHATTGITQDLYSHVFAASKVKAMQALELKLGGVAGTSDK